MYFVNIFGQVRHLAYTLYFWLGLFCCLQRGDLETLVYVHTHTHAHARTHTYTAQSRYCCSHIHCINTWHSQLIFIINLPMLQNKLLILSAFCFRLNQNVYRFEPLLCFLCTIVSLARKNRFWGRWRFGLVFTYTHTHAHVNMRAYVHIHIYVVVFFSFWLTCFWLLFASCMYFLCFLFSAAFRFCL